ncbi:ATP-binding cassette protein subfamily C, member 8, putative [Leishmania donovani]|uniref:ATP-binding cassette protein subfamily C, member 8, putative n=1 Tax=Leishmania donovani TaxID=5661 RepID=A0A3S7X7G7_LEIDO|nr:ATP-binding cassette protein subfamily C, member 8, putative [Leishmania donovani]
MGKAPAMPSSTLTGAEVRASRSRATFLVHGVLRRIPGYAFFLIHLCFVHILWGQLVDQFFNATITFTSANVTKTDLAKEAFIRVCNRICRSVDQTLLHGLVDVLKTKGGTGATGALAASREILAFLWKSPSSMVLFFGLAFICLNSVLAALRLFTGFLSSLTALCRSRRQLERSGSRKPVPLHITVRYGNGYDSMLRFALAAVELAWFMSYPVLNSTEAAKSAADKTRRVPGATEPTYASLRQLQVRHQAIASFQIEASLLLPPQLFDSTADAIAAGAFVIIFVKVVLGVVVALDAQRLFHALVGVRPLFIPNGWERCPVCGALWKRSRKATNAVHLCPNIFTATPLLSGCSPGMTASDTEEEEDMRGQVLGTVRRGVGDRRRVGPPTEAAHRPGDAFPNPNTASFASLVTDSWLSPLMNFTLLSPLNTFSPPPLSSITDDGRGHWRALLRVVDRLPRLPRSLRTRDTIDEPAWTLWQRRHEPAARGEVRWLERSFMAITEPIRRVLLHAFAVFFLPPSARGADTRHGEWGPVRSGSSLFRVFLRHPSGRQFVLVCVPLKLTQDLLSLLAPRVVKSLVAFLKEVSTSNISVRQNYLGRGLLICLSLILVVSLQALFFQLYLTHLYASCLKSASALKTLLLRQSLATPLAYTGGGRGGGGKRAPMSPSASDIPHSPTRPSEKNDGRVKDALSLSTAIPTAEEVTTTATLSREGEVMSLLTVDITNCADCLIFLHNVWGHPFVIISSLMSMYTYVGFFSTLATFAALIALIPLNRSSAARVRTAQQQAKNNESRLSDLTAALSSMRTVKSMALEECLVGRVEEARVRESDGTKLVGQAESVAAAQTEVTTLLVALVCCGSYLLTGGVMEAAVLVPTMAALQVMRFPVWTLPHLYSQVSRGYTSMLRIERFLSELEAGENASTAYVEHRLRQQNGEGAARDVQPSVAVAVRAGEVRCERGTFAWNTQAAVADQIAFDNALSCNSPKGSRGYTRSPNAASKESDRRGEEDAPSSSMLSAYSSPRESGSRAVVLHGITLNIFPGEFVVVHGPTGCGKSALLLSMLGELYVMPNGSHATSTRSTTVASSETRASSDSQGFQVGGRVVYCAEVPWLRQGTMRENIRLVSDDVPESATEREWYNRVLEACALKNDIKALAKGDRTMVGEGGSKLSGGQRARVALARAVYRYSETDVFIFDDVLSALDVEVQKHIIANLFHGLLCAGAGSSSAAQRRTKTIVLATHAAVSLLMPDRVLHLWPDGTLHEDMTHQAPTEDQVHQQKSAWRNATAAAATKEQRRSIQYQAAGAAAADLSTRQNDSTFPPSTKSKPVAETSPKSSSAPSVRPPATGIDSLLPRAADLRRLFIEYIGGGRLLWFFVLSVSMQLFRTLMDNWLGVYISLYDKRNAAYETILRSTKSQRARKFMLDMLSLVVLRGDKATPAPPPPPVVPVFTIFGVPVVWRNPFVLDTVVAQFLGTYAFIGLSAALLSMIRTDYFFRSYQRMADALQLHAVRKLFKAPVSYFDRIPSSRLLQILSRDQEVVDRALGESVQLIFLTILQLFGMVCFNAIHFGPFIAVLPISALLFYHLTVRFLSFTKQVRALEGVLQSRSVAVMKDAVNGAITIRAFGSVLQNQLVQEMNEALDAVHVAANAGLTADRWVALRLEFVALALTSALALLSVLTVCLSATTSAGSAAFAGLGIISSMTASRSLSMLCRRFGMFQNQFVSAEQLLRLEEEIPEEDTPAAAEGCSDDESSASEQRAATEPDTCLLLDVRHLCAKYQPQLPWVLSDICFTLRPGECVGLIGRTGNGKSSLFNALLGLMDVVEGEIRIPGALFSSSPKSKARQLNAIHLPQHELRKNYFQLVSQEPLLLQGTCRSNLILGLDDGSAASREASGEPRVTVDAEALDVRLSAVLRKVALDELLEPSYAVPAPGQPAVTGSDGEVASSATRDAAESASDSTASPTSTVDVATRALDHVVTAGGSNLSAGQRQLLCLARAILHRPHVVLLDEVSSRVDRRTDDLIQRVIKEEMLCRGGKDNGDSSAVKSGVLLIAHRLETIMSLCDSVIVIEKGRCVAHLSKEEVNCLEDLESYL